MLYFRVYHVLCTDGTTPATGTVTGAYTYTFTSADGIKAETEYTCSVAVNPGSDLSAYSSPSLVTTQVGASMYRFIYSQFISIVKFLFIG